MIFLLVNDDGIEAPGLAALERIARTLGDVVVVAPDGERSSGGHTVTKDRAIRVETVGPARFRVHGTPADCARLGVTALAPDAAWVLAGINAGANLGADVPMSGTVAAVHEAARLGRPGMAISQLISGPIDWEVAGANAARALEDLLACEIPPHAFWNVNLPDSLRGPVHEPPAQVPLDPGPHQVLYRCDGDHYVFEGRWERRPVVRGCDVEACFAGRITATLLRTG